MAGETLLFVSTKYFHWRNGNGDRILLGWGQEVKSRGEKRRDYPADPHNWKTRKSRSKTIRGGERAYLPFKTGGWFNRRGG